jgi:hypothetical protein
LSKSAPDQKSSKHLDSHIKPYRCRSANECARIEFSSTGVLYRHQREAHNAHGAPVFRCPYENCERSTRPFPRLYNMRDHVRRIHQREGTSGSPSNSGISESPGSSQPVPESRPSRRESSQGLEEPVTAPGRRVTAQLQLGPKNNPRRTLYQARTGIVQESSVEHQVPTKAKRAKLTNNKIKQDTLSPTKQFSKPSTQAETRSPTLTRMTSVTGASSGISGAQLNSLYLAEASTVSSCFNNIKLNAANPEVYDKLILHVQRLKSIGMQIATQSPVQKRKRGTDDADGANSDGG